jgi:hypothetical protein
VYLAADSPYLGSQEGAADRCLESARAWVREVGAGRAAALQPSRDPMVDADPVVLGLALFNQASVAAAGADSLIVS